MADFFLLYLGCAVQFFPPLFLGRVDCVDFLDSGLCGLFLEPNHVPIARDIWYS